MVVGGMDGSSEEVVRLSSTRSSLVDGRLNGIDGRTEDAVTLFNAQQTLDDSTAPIPNNLGMLDREKRKQSAAKSDNLEVPEYLWFEHMFDDESWHWDSTIKQQIKKMSEWF
jgi:hypothetical protein